MDQTILGKVPAIGCESCSGGGMAFWLEDGRCHEGEDSQSDVCAVMKTEASRKPVSMEPELAGLLADWKTKTSYAGLEDWLFASPECDGLKPYWADSVLVRHVRPAAERAGITKLVGWHTFRHTLATVLKSNGEDVKTVQEILRHANSRITMDIYAQAVTPAKRQAQQRVLEMILPEARYTQTAATGS